MEQGTQKLWGETRWVPQALGGVGEESSSLPAGILALPLCSPSVCAPLWMSTLPLFASASPLLESGSTPCLAPRGGGEAHRQWLYKGRVTTGS